MSNPSLESILADDEFVRRIARRLVRDGPTADDLTQSAYVEALEHGPASAPTRGWIATVVRHLALNRHRSEQRRARHEHAAARPEELAPESLLVEREEVRQRLVAAILRLGAPRSTVVILRYFDDLPPRAIAKRLGMPVETVRTHLKRAHAELRARLGTERRSDGSSVFAALPLLLPAEKLGPLVLGVALMTAKTKLALFVLTAALAVVVWMAIRPEADAIAPPNTGQARSEPATSAPATQPATLAAPATVDVERAPLEAQRPDSIATPADPITATLRGVVVDPVGAPVEGAFVQGAISGSANSTIFEDPLLGRLMLGDARGAPDEVRADGSFQAHSRADGTFEVSGLPVRDSYDVSAWSGNLGVVVVAGVPVRAAESATVTLRFERSVVLHGVVVNEAGAPLSGANIQVMGSKDGNTYGSFLYVKTAEDGSWKTPPLAWKAFYLAAEAAGYQRGSRQITWDPQREREVRADFHLAPAPVLAGRFVNEDGTPARLSAALAERGIDTKRSQVELLGSYDDPAVGSNFRDIGHDDGTIAWDEDRWQLTPDDTLPRYVSLWCGTTMLGVAQPVAGTDADLVVHYARLPVLVRRDLVVRIVDAQRVAVSGVTARLKPGPGQPGGRNAPKSALAAEPGTEGVLRAEGVVLGEYDLRVSAPGYVPRRMALVVDDGPGPVEANVTLSLASHRASVVARTSSGEPVAGAQIFVLDADGVPVDSNARATTNLEGRAELAGLGAGECTFLATHERLACAGRRVRVREDLGEVLLTMPEAVEVKFESSGLDGPFSFRVTDETGITVFEDACTEIRRFGQAVTLRLPPGRHTVVAHCPGFVPGEATVDVVPGLKVEIPLVALPR